jgi:inner membrane protein
MTGKTHLLIGLATGLTLAWTKPSPDLLFYVGILAGSLAPDVDHPNSMATRAFPPFRLFSLVFEHRGIFHSLLVPLILAAAAYAYPPQSASLAGVSIGWALHLLADALTLRGIPALWPFSKNKMGIPLMVTGGLKEWILSSALMGICVYQSYQLLLPFLLPYLQEIPLPIRCCTLPSF